MTAAPQGTLIQIFVELSKWGVGEPPSWSVSRQVSCRWLVTAGPHAGLKESPQRGFWVLLAKRKMMEEDGAMVLGLVVVGRFVQGWEQCGGICPQLQALHRPSAVLQGPGPGWGQPGPCEPSSSERGAGHV